MRNVILLCCVVALLGCKESGRSSQPAPAASPSTESKPAPGFARDAFKPPEKPIEGEPVDPQKLVPVLPDALDGYVAESPAEPRRVNVPNGGALTTAKRAYTKADSKLELEVIDSLHSPNIRSIVKLSAQIETNTPSVVRKPEKVGDYLAIAQWHQATNMARIGILVDDRFILNVNVGPTTSPELGLSLARKLDLAPLSKLAAEASAESKAGPSAETPAATAEPPGAATAGKTATAQGTATAKTATATPPSAPAAAPEPTAAPDEP